MGSNIVRTYLFTREIASQTTAVDFVAHLERGLECQKSRDNFALYMRTIGRQLQHESNESNSRWGIGDTYGHTRAIPHPGMHGGKRGRNDSYRTFPRGNRYIPRDVNCSVGEDVEYEEDNGDYFDGDWDNSDYQGDRP